MKSLVFACLLLFIVQSCTVEKRLYNSGYHIEWKQRKLDPQPELEIVEQSPIQIIESETNFDRTENQSPADTNVSIDLPDQVVVENIPNPLPSKEFDDSLKIKSEDTLELDVPDPNRKLIDGTPAALKMAEVAAASAGLLLLTGLLALLAFYSSNLALFTVALFLGALGLIALITGIICFFASFKRKNELTKKELETYKLLKFFSGLVLPIFVVAYVKVIQFLRK